MDEDLRKAHRILERAHGFDEVLLAQDFARQVCGYLAYQGLTVEFGGVSSNSVKVPGNYNNRILVSQNTHFVESINLPQEENPLIKIIAASSWDNWFHVVSYYQYFISNRNGSSIWSKIRSRPQAIAPDGSTFTSRMAKSMNEWKQFKIVCTLHQPWQSSLHINAAEGTYMWSASISLVGFNPQIDTVSKDEDARGEPRN